MNDLKLKSKEANDPVLGSRPSVATVAVIGNPNAGKTTIFNRLTGLSQRVGNYPGVTVEKKVGHLILEGTEARLIDLPGTYSLAAHSPDEMVAVDVLLGHQEGESRPDLVLEIVDSSNLERNLYLLSQVLELGVPVVVALNMTDIAHSRGMSIDGSALSKRLGVPVVPVQGHKGVGIAELKATIGAALKEIRESSTGWGHKAASAPLQLSNPLHEEVAKLHRELGPRFQREKKRGLHPVEILRALIDRGGHAESRLTRALGERCLEEIEASRATIAASMPLPALEAKLRYAWVRDRLHGCLRRTEVTQTTWTDRMDRVLTHRVFGLLIFATMMLVVFQSIFVWARPVMDLIEMGFQSAGNATRALLPEGALRSLLVEGVIAGVGMVVVFLPQIIFLFFFIGLLEDCGYMARAAFLMDKVMSKCGLSGKSFIPMLSGFACAVPGIMATRVIEDRKDRIATILVTPLMSCSARLPVYSIFIGTFIPEQPVIPGVLGLQALTLFALYALGIVVAVVVAWVLRRTLLRGSKPPFVLELPSYKWPAMSGVLFRLFDRAKAFLLRAGTTILAIAIVVWALAYFPHSNALRERYAQERARLYNNDSSGVDRPAALKALAEAEAGAYLRDSYFGRMGHAVEPLFLPLGWDWRISMAAMASFPAREVIVATLGTIYNLGKEVDEKSVMLRESLRKARWPGEQGGQEGPPVFNIPVALSIMVFFALCCQCGATVATIKRETNSWRWAWFAFSYMSVLAYVGALITYQVGLRI